MLEVLTDNDKQPCITAVKILLSAVAVKEVLRHLTSWKYDKVFF